MGYKTPETVSFSGQLLEKMKAEGTVSQAVLDVLREKAEQYKDAPSLVVVDQKVLAVSGNPHDYTSVGPYWWPDPDSPNGLPYIRRDGEHNPESIDPVTHVEMAERVFVLALAAYHLNNMDYAKASVRMLYDWHLNPETYMTPHADFAQSIPGVCDGRGIGLIDFRLSFMVFDAIGILAAMGAMDDQMVADLKKWYTDFANWMLTSDNGMDEDVAKNNHGTFFDVQLLAIGIFTGRESLIKKIRMTSYDRRFRRWVEPDGKQPLELARTRAMGYSTANSRGLLLIAQMAKRYGYTEYVEPDAVCGTCLVSATVDYIYPFIKAPETFPYDEIYNVPVEGMCQILSLADSLFPEKGYAKMAEELSEEAYYWQAYPNQ